MGSHAVYYKHRVPERTAYYDAPSPAAGPLQPRPRSAGVRGQRANERTGADSSSSSSSIKRHPLVPSSSAAIALSLPRPRSAGVRNQRAEECTDDGGGGEFSFSFPYHDAAAVIKQQRPRAPSPSTASNTLSLWSRSACAKDQPGTAKDFVKRGVFNSQRHGGFSFDTASSTSIRAAADDDADDFYARCARIYAPSLCTTATTTLKSPHVTMEAWMGMTTRTRSSRASNDTDELNIGGLALAQHNISAAFAPQPDSGSRGWSPMGPSYRHATPDSSSVVVSYPPPGSEAAAASSAQGVRNRWYPMAHRNQEPAAGMGWQDVLPKKAQLCVHWMTAGACRYGARCGFSHAGEPLRQTQACRNVQAGLRCPFGPRCHFHH